MKIKKRVYKTEDQPSISKPSVYLTDKDVKNVSQVNMEQEVMLKGKVMSKTIEEREGKKTVSCRIEITDVVLENEKKEDKENA